MVRFELSLTVTYHRMTPFVFTMSATTRITSAFILAHGFSVVLVEDSIAQTSVLFMLRDDFLYFVNLFVALNWSTLS